MKYETKIFNIAKQIHNISIDEFGDDQNKIAMWIFTNELGWNLWYITQLLVRLGVKKSEIKRIDGAYPGLRVSYSYVVPDSFGTLPQTGILTDVYNQWKRIQMLKYLQSGISILPTAQELKYLQEMNKKTH